MEGFDGVQVSAGLVFYRRAGGRRKYLLILNAKGHWDWPKGHVEKGESFDSAMAREAAEETGIRKFVLEPGFFREVSWSFVENGRRIFKIAFFGLARAGESGIRLSREHREWRWLGFPEAARLLAFRESRGLLAGAEFYLRSRRR